jgi:hypothetical protein
MLFTVELAAPARGEQLGEKLSRVMSRFKDHTAIYDQLISLSEREKQAPIEVIKDFFADYRLSEVREIQDQIQKVCLTADDAVYNQPEARSNLIFYNEKLIRLLEAACQLRDVFVPTTVEIKTEDTIKKSVPTKVYDDRIPDLVKGVNYIAIDVANLYLFIVKAWTAKMEAEFKARLGNPKKPATVPQLPPVDLDKLHAMAQDLQSKLAKLSGLAIDILIKEIYHHHITPAL